MRGRHPERPGKVLKWIPNPGVARSNRVGDAKKLEAAFFAINDWIGEEVVGFKDDAPVAAT